MEMYCDLYCFMFKDKCIILDKGIEFFYLGGIIPLQQLFY